MKKRSLSNSKLRRKSSVAKKPSVTNDQAEQSLTLEGQVEHLAGSSSSPKKQSPAVSYSTINISSQNTATSRIQAPKVINADPHCVETLSNSKVTPQEVSNTTAKQDFQISKEVSFMNSEVCHSPSVDTPILAINNDADYNDDLPSTQILDNRVLKDVIAYVEVRTTNDNRSEAIRKELVNLGAVVTKKFTDDVTHVIFKEGSNRTKNKAIKTKCHLVSVLWVDSCKQYQEHVSETLYPAFLPTTSKGTPLLIGKLKKAKSMQPTAFEDEVANSAERYNKKKKKVLDKFQTSETTPQNSPNLGRILVQETQPRTPIDLNTPIRLMIPDTPPSMREKLEQLRTKDSDTPVLDKDEDPLQRRLFSANASFDSNDVDHLVDGLKDEINKCINSVGMPESPIPTASSISSHTTSKSTKVDNPKGNNSTDKVTSKKVSKIDKRRKSMSVVKFANTCDESVKPKRTSNRRKSIAIVTPTEDTYQEDNLSDVEKEVPVKSKKKSVSGRRKSMVMLKTSDPVDDATTDSDLPTLESLHNSGGKKVSTVSSLRDQTSTVTSQDEILNTNDGNESLSRLNKGQRRKSVKGKRKSMASDEILALNNEQTTSKVLANKNDRDGMTGDHIHDQCIDNNKTEATDNSNVMDTNDVQEEKATNLEVPSDKSSSCELKDSSNKSSKRGPKRTNSKKRLLPLADIEPDLPLMSKTPEYQSPITARRKKIKSASECNSSISALFPHSSSVKKQVRASSVSDKSSISNISGLSGPPKRKSTSSSICTSSSTKQRTTGSSLSHQGPTSSSSSLNCNNNATEVVELNTDLPNITMTDDLTPVPNTEQQTANNLTLQETTVNSTCNTTQNDNSMSAVFGETFINSLSGRVPPRPSIDEFNLRTNRHIRKHKLTSSTSTRPSDSDSSDGGVTKKYKRSSPSRPSLVMTSLHAEEQDVIISVVKQLGHFVISDNVIESTTHLICGGPRRTLNVLYGIMKGIWIVNKQWVLSSLEAHRWLPEDNFEVTEFFPVVKVTREGRLLHKENYRQLSLKEVGTIYVAQKTSPPRHHLLNLLKLCGAKVINNPSKADIYMGHEFVPDKICVNPVWVLDCITHQNVIDMERYLLGRPKRESSPEF